MYFNVEAPTQIVDRFHFALREGGFLFLGKAEMLLNDSDRFDVMSVRQRMFRRRPGEAVTPYQPAPMKLRAGMNAELHSAARHRQMRDLILDAAPNAALAVDGGGTVVLVNTQARAQFGLTPADIGRPFQDLELSYRPVELRSLIEQATHERRTLRVNGVERRIAEDVQYFDIVVQPLAGPDGPTAATSITFSDVTVATHLRSEIKRVRDDLETAYEELQSTNEELETTNEELQAGNEELETMNEEMRVRTEELDEARAFLEAVLTSIGAGIVVLDQSMRVKSWNRGAVGMWGLRPDEVLDQPFFDLDFGLPAEKLRETVLRCVEAGRRGAPLSVPAVNRLGRAINCLVHCSPFDGYHGGVVLLMEEGRTDALA